jgi:DNA-binding transcriptional MocR family regulator
MSSEAIFDGAPEQGTINFSVGQPSADLLPLALLSTAGQRFFAAAEPLELNYGQRQGDVRFRTALADFSASPLGGPWTPTR